MIAIFHKVISLSTTAARADFVISMVVLFLQDTPKYGKRNLTAQSCKPKKKSFKKGLSLNWNKEIGSMGSIWHVVISFADPLSFHFVMCACRKCLYAFSPVFVVIMHNKCLAKFFLILASFPWVCQFQ